MMEGREFSIEPGARPDPEGEAAALTLSASLLEQVRDEILRTGGFLSFHRYMEMVLYTPALGYYVNGRRKLGPDGDFVTAPEVSPLYGATLAQWLAPVLQPGAAGLLEFGAGSGRMAADVIARLDALGTPLDHYWIMEVSPDLRAQQQALLAAKLGAERMLKVSWLDRLPEQPFRGVILANEVLDAVPVEVFVWRNQSVWQRGVEWVDGAPAFAERAAPAPLEHAVRVLEAEAGPWPEGYTSEWRPALGPWLAAVSECLDSGLVWIADYGFPRRAYYAAERREGTLTGYSRQKMVLDPFVRPGLVDLTASVDFTAVAEAASAAGLEVLTYAAQGEFLLGAGLPALFEQWAGSGDDPRQTLELAQQVRMLTLPGEMGERFQIMVLGRDCDLPPGSFPDRRERL